MISGADGGAGHSRLTGLGFKMKWVGDLMILILNSGLWTVGGQRYVCLHVGMDVHKNVMDRNGKKYTKQKYDGTNSPVIHQLLCT